MTAVAVKMNRNMIDEGDSYADFSLFSPREIDAVVVSGSNRVV